MKQNGGFINMMNLKVTLEDYSIEEDADEGYDMYATTRCWPRPRLGRKSRPSATTE